MATESPNTLVSNTRIKIVDILSEGTIMSFTPVSGVSGANPLCSVYFDDVPVMNGDGSTNYNISGQGFVFSFVSGASGQLPMSGFEKVEALVPLPVNTRLFYPPPGQGITKMVVASFNTAQYPDAEGIKVTLRVPAMYTVDTSNGDTNAFSVFYEIDISTNGGPWEAQILGPDSNGDPSTVEEILGKCTSPYYRTHVIPLPKPEAGATYYEWKVRARRISENVMSNNTQNDLYVDSLAVISSNSYSYPMTALAALELSADQFSAIPTRAYDIKGIKVLVPEGYTPTQYNTDGTITAAVYPGIWTGVWGERKWTDNPAFIFYDLCTNKRYGLGNYIRREWIDKWTIYQIAQYCDEMVDDGDGGLEPRFTCNVALSTPEDAYTLLNNLVSVFRGMLYWANGSIFPVGSETRDPVYNFSNANVVGGAFSYADTPRTTRSTICVIRWNDPDNMFRSTPERIEDPEARAKYGAIVKEISAFATTSRGQAIRAANWILTAEQQLTDTVQFQTDLEGVYLRPGDIINVYDNLRNNQQQGGRILDFNAARTELTLDKDVNLYPSFTYYMAALVPATNISNASGITGSNQYGLIRNSQIETRQVTTPAGTGLNYITVNSGFSSSLFRGSVFILNASGSSVTIFDQATQYRVLSTTETEPGKIGVLAVEYQTGVNYLVNNNYSSVVTPPIVGNTTPPGAPTGITGARITGLLTDNTFFSYAYVYWSGLDVINTAYYDVSGRLNANPWFLIGQSTTTGIQFVPNEPGNYALRVAAFNANGYGSAYNEGTYVEPATNPFGTTAPLSGIVIAENFDPFSYSAALGKYTGYVGTQPVFRWDVALSPSNTDNEVPSAQYITGYRARIISATGGEWNLLANPIFISGKDNTTLTWNADFLYTGASIKPLRAFTLAVDTMDSFAQIASGARLVVNNIQPAPPIASGFVGFNGGVSYNITPARTADISGVYLWTNTSPSFTPRFDNTTLKSTNLAGFVDGPQAGSVYTWFSFVDSYGPSGSILANGDYNTRIYGPISGNANQIAGELFIDITDEINNAFGLLTGEITVLQRQITGVSGLTLQLVQGLSGSFTGTSGAIYQGLNVQLQQIIANSGSVLSQQINGVAATANLISGNLTATGGSVLTALATSGGALSSYIQSLQAYTSGQNARVTIAAQAFVTGDVNGFGGAAVARWGFKLDTNGKVVSMEATSESFSGSYGTIVFGNANLQSNTFTAGSSGWRITADGNAEFNNASIRGAFTGGVGSSQTSIDGRGLTVGTGSLFTQIGGSDAYLRIATPGTNAVVISAINTSSIYGGDIRLYTEAAPATPVIGLKAADGGEILVGDEGEIAIRGATRGSIHFTKAGTNVSYLEEDWGINLRGDSTHPIQLRNAALVRGSAGGSSYSVGNIYGFGIQLDPAGTAPNDILAGTHGGADTAFTNYLILKVNGATVYVPYTTTAP